MEQIYESQNIRYITAEHHRPLSQEVASAKIMYWEPDDIDEDTPTGSWVASYSPAFLKLTYAAPFGTTFTLGKWKIQSQVVLVDGSTRTGDPDFFMVKKDGTP